MNIVIKHTDLLEEETEAIVNTVNCVGVMGKGIALQFKQKWPDNFKAYRNACKKGLVQPGKMFVYEINSLFVGARYIINFPTKNHWQEKSRISYIEEGLQDLMVFITTHKIRSIAIPPLGCGNGGLKWVDVKKLIEEHLNKLQTLITVHMFEPQEVLSPASMKIRTKKPKMTAGRAVLIKLISIYNQMRYPLSKIEIQKLCYFSQISGESLKLNFAKNKYGPYADELRHVLNNMDGHYLHGVGDSDKMQAQIKLTDYALQEAEDFLSQNDNGTRVRISKVEELINGFETPYGMELLATVHWAATHDTNKATDLKRLIKNIYNWNPTEPSWNQRKQTLMEPEHIKIALEQLSRFGWIG